MRTVSNWRRRRQLIEWARAPRPSSYRRVIDRSEPEILSESDVELIRQGKHATLYKRLGAHPFHRGDVRGTRFAVWAPNAERASVVGDFNGWDVTATPMELAGDHGVWAAFVPSVGDGARYKYAVQAHGQWTHRADPYAFGAELRPATASIVRTPERYRWNDAAWMSRRHRTQAPDQPMSIYELHLGSWMDAAGAFTNYRELAERLIPYVLEMGYTHIELMPITEHPFDRSWGYQTTGYFAPTARYGSPRDFQCFVDQCHQNGIGVLLDWVPGHFPRDEFALASFDGTCLYEHLDPRQGLHPHWGTLIFNFGRHEVRSFLLSSAMCWCDYYHIDGFRVDAVASMLYLDYGREHGQWIPNRYGNNGNLEAMEFIRDLNQIVRTHHPGVLTIAEESTTWPGVSHPVEQGGLGFSMKWNMGWMNDTLRYFSRDFAHRSHHQGELTNSLNYAWSEQFVLPFSHDEVVHGKCSLLSKMPGDEWQKFAGLRLMLAYTFAHPGKKLLFMGHDLAMWNEWSEEVPLDWRLLDRPAHAGVNRVVRDLNKLYRNNSALHELDFSPAGFEWIDCADSHNCVIAFVRRAKRAKSFVLAVANLTPAVHHNYRIGVPEPGCYRELLNTDDVQYGGSGVRNIQRVCSEPIEQHGRTHSIALTLPPLAMLFLELVFGGC